MLRNLEAIIQRSWAKYERRPIIFLRATAHLINKKVDEGGAACGCCCRVARREPLYLFCAAALEFSRANGINYGTAESYVATLMVKLSVQHWPYYCTHSSWCVLVCGTRRWPAKLVPRKSTNNVACRGEQIHTSAAWEVNELNLWFGERWIFAQGLSIIPFWVPTVMNFIKILPWKMNI